MSVAMLVDNPAGSRELYESILDKLDHDVPLGGILHVAGPGPEGGWRVIEQPGLVGYARAPTAPAGRTARAAGGRTTRPAAGRASRA